MWILISKHHFIFIINNVVVVQITIFDVARLNNFSSIYGCGKFWMNIFTMFINSFKVVDLCQTVG